MENETTPLYFLAGDGCVSGDAALFGGRSASAEEWAGVSIPVDVGRAGVFVDPRPVLRTTAPPEAPPHDPQHDLRLDQGDAWACVGEQIAELLYNNSRTEEFIAYGGAEDADAEEDEHGDG